MTTWLPGLDVVIDGSGGLVSLNRAVFSAALQEVRPVTLHVVCPAAAMDAVRRDLAPILALAGDVGFELCARAAEGKRRYRAALGVGDVIYPEGWRLLMAALEAGAAAVAAGAVLEAAVAWGAVPYVTGKRRREPVDGHGCVVDRARASGAGVCRIDAVVGETWLALR